MRWSDHARAPAAYRTVLDGSLARRFTSAVASGCRTPGAVIAHDGVGVQCEGEEEFRAAVTDEDNAAAFSTAEAC